MRSYKLIVAFLVLSLLLSSSVYSAPVTIRWSTWLSGESLAEQQKLIDMFEKKYPDIKVKVETTPYSEYTAKLFTQHAAGNAPDVMHTTIYFADEYIRKGLLLDVTKYVKKSIDFKRYVKFSPIYVREGKIWGGLETHNQVYPLFYNVNMFKEAGLPTPNDYYYIKKKWDLQTFLEVAKKLTRDVNGDGKIDVWGTYVQSGWETGWFPFVLLFDGEWRYPDGGTSTVVDVTSRKVTIDTPKVVDALKFYIGLIQQEKVAPLPGELAIMGTPLEAKKVAMMIDGSWMMNIYKARIKDFEWDIAHPPKGTVLRTHIDAGADGLVWAGTKHPEEAWKLVEFFLGEEVQMAKARSKLVIPVLRSALYSKEYLTAPPRHIKVIHEMIGYSVPIKPFEGMLEVLDGMSAELEAAMLGKKSVDEAIKAAVEVGNKILGLKR